MEKVGHRIRASKRAGITAIQDLTGYRLDIMLKDLRLFHFCFNRTELEDEPVRGFICRKILAFIQKPPDRSFAFITHERRQQSKAGSNIDPANSASECSETLPGQPGRVVVQTDELCIEGTGDISAASIALTVSDGDHGTCTSGEEVPGVPQPPPPPQPFIYHSCSRRLYDTTQEYRRMNLLSNPTSNWKITLLNDEYLFCPTYPSILFVPASFDEQNLSRVRNFRSRNRIPVLSWIHPINQATICRSSQPRTGVTGIRSSEDEMLLR